jgi:hypothetical protein
MNKPNEPNDTDDFAAKAKGVFDESVERLDGAALSRLNQGRHIALEKLETARTSANWRRWALVGGVTAIALISVVVLRAPGVDDIPRETAADFEIFLEDESLEMFEDLEFYSWIDEAELNANANVG